MQSSLADLDGVTVAARALGWDSSNADEWALSHGDLPLLVNQIGTLTITYVDALDYTQFVVNGIPVDSATIEPVDYSGDVLVAGGGWEKVPRDTGGKWTAGPAGSGQKPTAGWAEGTAGVVQKHLAGIATMQELQDHLAATGYKGSTLVLLTAMENLSAGKVISSTQEAALTEIGVVLDVPASGPKIAAGAQAEQLILAHLNAPFDVDLNATLESKKVLADKLTALGITPADQWALQVAIGAKNKNLPLSDADITALTNAGIAVTVSDAAGPPPVTPLTPGQKAALTKKMNAAAGKEQQTILDDLSAGNITGGEALGKLEALTGSKADALAIMAKKNAPDPNDPQVQASLNESLASAALKGYVNSVEGGHLAEIPNEFTLMHASDGHVDDYLKQQMSKKSYDALQFADRRAVAIALAKQHAEDVANLAALDSYPGAGKMLAVDARRTMLREAGERKPTGAPSSPGTRVFYGEAAILAMSREKQIAIIAHHAALQSTTNLDALDDQFIASRAVKADANYKQVIGELALKIPAVDMATVPHSYISALMVQQGNSIGLPPKQYVSAVVTAAPVAIGKPANWAEMSSGKKAAWTKKNKAGLPQPVEVPKPAEWDSMSPGKKAAWTKKNKAQLTGIYAGKTLAGGQLGEHVVKTFYTEEHQKNANSNAVDALAKDVNFNYQQHANRVTNFQQKMDYGMTSAWDDYTGSGYKAINRCAKYGTGCGGATLEKIKLIQQSIEKFGTPAPKTLFRGKKAGPLADLDFKVGTEFTEPGFGSWAATLETPKSFAGTDYGGVDRNVIYRLKDTHGVRSAPGTPSEHETITPAGCKYRVVGIQDFVHNGKVRRILDVELVYAPFG